MRKPYNDSIGDVIKNLDGFVGDFLGRGATRKVYEWRIGLEVDKIDTVVKFATNSAGIESNLTEAKVWDYCPKELKKHFCPVFNVSANYKVLLMQKAMPITDTSLRLHKELSDKLKKFFTGDFGTKNLGEVDGDIKIIDYGFIDFKKLIKNTIK